MNPFASEVPSPLLVASCAVVGMALVVLLVDATLSNDPVVPVVQVAPQTVAPHVLARP